MADDMVSVTWASHRDSKKVGTSEKVTRARARSLAREGLVRVDGDTKAPAKAPTSKPKRDESSTDKPKA